MRDASPAIIIGTVRSLRTWLCGRYHVPQNAFLVKIIFKTMFIVYGVVIFAESSAGPFDKM